MSHSASGHAAYNLVMHRMMVRTNVRVRWANRADICNVLYMKKTRSITSGSRRFLMSRELRLLSTSEMNGCNQRVGNGEATNQKLADEVVDSFR
jgi:hypothetical protein